MIFTVINVLLNFIIKEKELNISMLLLLLLLKYRPIPLRYFSLEILEKEKELLKKNEEQLQVMEEEKEKEKAEENVLIKAATDIQKLFRGYKCRERVNHIKKQHKKLEKLREEKRKADDAVRNTLKYKLENVFGCAPKLESDKPHERINKAVSIFGRIGRKANRLPGTISVIHNSNVIFTSKDLHMYLVNGDKVNIDGKDYLIGDSFPISKTQIPLETPFTGESGDGLYMYKRPTPSKLSSGSHNFLKNNTLGHGIVHLNASTDSALESVYSHIGLERASKNCKEKVIYYHNLLESPPTVYIYIIHNILLERRN